MTRHERACDRGLSTLGERTLSEQRTLLVAIWQIERDRLARWWRALGRVCGVTMDAASERDIDEPSASRH